MCFLSAYWERLKEAQNLVDQYSRLEICNGAQFGDQRRGCGDDQGWENNQGSFKDNKDCLQDHTELMGSERKG